MPDTLKRLSLILGAITDGILVVDKQGMVLYANQAAQQLLDRDTIIGQSLAIPIIDSHSEHQDINLIRRSGFAWAEMRSSPIEWEGMPAYVIGLRDITARKHMEIALQESEALFQTLAKMAPVGIFRSNAQGQYEYVNKRWCDISGLTPEQAIGDSWSETILPADRDRVSDEWQQCIRTHKPFNSQYRFEHANGSIHWVIAHAEAELDNDQTLLGYVGTVTDISGIKNNEERLSQAAAVFETTREGVMITDDLRQITMVNRAFSEITGYSLEETLGNTPSILRSGRHSVDFYQQMWSEIASNGHWQGEIWNRRKNGEIYPELLSISTVRNQIGEISNYVGVFSDISKLKASERELEFLALRGPESKAVASEGRVDPGSRSAGRFFD